MDAARAIVASPLLLLMQILALPVYLWLFMGRQLANLNIAEQLVPVFLGLILLPLALAWLTEWASARSAGVTRFIQGSAWWSVPLLALVIFMIAVSQSGVVL